MLAASLGPGAFPSSLRAESRDKFTDACERHCIPQLLINAVQKKFNASVIGVCATHGTTGTQVAISF